MAVVGDNYDSSHFSPSMDRACSANWEGQSISVGEPCSRFDKPSVEFNGKCGQMYTQ